MIDAHVSSGLSASLVAASISALGLLSMAALGDWGRRQSPSFSAFAIGVLLVAILFHLAPEALHQAGGEWWPAPAAFFALALLGLGLRFGFRRRYESERLAFGFASLIALGFHSFMDGVIYATSFRADEYTGWLATAGLLLHEFPEGVIAFFLVRDAGLSRLSSIAMAFLASSLTTVGGAAAAAGLFAAVGAPSVGLMLTATAGALLYVVFFHLGPHALMGPARRTTWFATLGVIVATAAEVLHHAGGHHH